MPLMPKFLPGDLLKARPSSVGEAIVWVDDDSAHVKVEHEVGYVEGSWTLLSLAAVEPRDGSQEFVLVVSPIGIGFVLSKFLVAA